MGKQDTLVAVAEDDPSMRRAIERLLLVAGMGCTGFASAEAFLAGRVEPSPDLAAIDVNLGALDGLQLQARLKAEVPTLPVIIITVRISAEVHRVALDQGCAAFLVEPFPGTSLIDAIRQALPLG